MVGPGSHAAPAERRPSPRRSRSVGRGRSRRHGRGARATRRAVRDRRHGSAVGRLSGRVPEDQAQMLLGLFLASRRGEFAATDPALEELLGRPPQSAQRPGRHRRLNARLRAAGHLRRPVGATRRRAAVRASGPVVRRGRRAGSTLRRRRASPSERARRGRCAPAGERFGPSRPRGEAGWRSGPR